MMSAPAARTSSGRIALTVAAVPTGMKAGVRISPRCMVMVPLRAAPSVALIMKENRVTTARLAAQALPPKIGCARRAREMPQISDIDRFVMVVGGPRCGTTTMARMLQAHPQVLFPFVKEPHYFSQHDLRGLDDAALRKTLQHDYLDHFFFNAPAERNVGFDGSISYLYAADQLEPVLKLWPGSRFIVGVRDPLTFLPSLHKRLVFTGDENIRRFEDAWAAIPERAAGRRIPWSTIDPRWLRYDQAARFGTYVERLFDAVGKERCLVVVFDDLATDPHSEQSRIMDFCGLPPIPLENSKPRRQGSGVRHIWLQQLLQRPPRFLLPYLASIHHQRRFDKALARSNAGPQAPASPSLRKRLLNWNKVPDVKQPIPLRVQQEIKAMFQGEVDKLGHLIGRDLSNWLQPKGA